MNGARQDHDDRKLDALIALAMERLQDEEPDFSDVEKLKANLTDEDRQQLEKTGKSFIRSLIAGHTEGVASSASVEPTWQEELEPELELAGAMNRGDDDELSEEAKEEIERRIREAHESGKKKKPTDDGSSPTPDCRK